MNPAYLVPRVIRHFLPERIVRFILLRSLIIKPGLETIDPQGAVLRYLDVLKLKRISLQGKRVFVFGYGGRLDIGVGLLDAGARYVVLCDLYARPDQRHNEGLQRRHPEYIVADGGAWRPSPDHLELIEGDIRVLAPPEAGQRFDLVISTSVYEHVDDARGVTKALARWTKAEGIHIHFVDLRDHYFRYPFEMLKFSERIWRSFLNPTSNHNRLRLWDYRQMFDACFADVEVEVLARDEAAFALARAAMQPEFISGVAAEDPATLIRIIARRPRL
jgi:SAM-dependent methyltransferase